MERNETTVCEKLFNAFHMHPSFRPLRRLTFRQQPDHAAAADAPKGSPPSLPDRPASHSSSGSELSSPLPQSPPAPKPKPPVAVATAKVDTLRSQPLTPTPSASVPKERAQQLPGVISKAGPNPTHAANIPASTAPAEVARGSSRSIVETAAASEAAVSQPGPEKARRNVNDKAEEYIARARRKMRTVTGVGRTPSSK